MGLDEETGMSRQRRWQLKQREQGKCTICGKPKVMADHCLDCWDKWQEGQRKRKGSLRRNKSKAYKLRERETEQCQKTD